MVAICCVCGIEKRAKRDLNLTFHCFPKDEDLKLKWYEAVGKKVYRNAYVCSKHFKTEDYKNNEDPNLIRRLLKCSAVPDYNLCRKLESIENSLFNTINISIKNKNDKSVEYINYVSSEYKNSIENKTSDNRLQDDALNISTKINNSVTKRLLDKAVSYSTADQTKKRKTEDCHALQSVGKQEYLNVISRVVRKEDFKNVNAWLRFQKYINEMRKQYQFVLHKNRRLHLKLSNFKDMLDTLRTK